MTVIVYKAGWCFADDMLWESNGNHVARGKKIAWRKRDGAIIMASGPAVKCAKFVKGGLAKIMPQDNGTSGADGANGYIAMRDGSIREYDGADYDEMQCDYWTLGAGGDLAMGALIVGADARQAAAAACIGKGWASGLHGVNHEGEWVYLPIEEVFQIAHRKHVPKPE